MPPRASHLPTYLERSILQKLSRGEIPATGLSPVATVGKMLTKGWIEHGSSPRVYRITPAGEAALRAKLPLREAERHLMRPDLRRTLAGGFHATACQICSLNSRLWKRLRSKRLCNATTLGKLRKTGACGSSLRPENPGCLFPRY
jgi:hypothetical protein